MEYRRLVRRADRGKGGARGGDGGARGTGTLSAGAQRRRLCRWRAPAAEVAVKMASADGAASELRSLLTSSEYRGAMARARALLCQLPEHGRAFPALDAIQLHGTPTQGLTARKMAKYCDVVEVAGAAAGGGRRQGCAQRRVWG